MATLKKQKSRKEYKCSKCGKKIEKGEEYYRFSVSRFNPLKPRCTGCKPKQSEMTQSEFLSTIWGIEEEIAKLGIDDLAEPQSVIENFTGQLEELRDETEDRLSNMPEQLQDAPTGELLQGRVDCVQEMIDELEAIDTDIDEELDVDERKRLERQQEIYEELQNIGYSGE